MLFLHSLDYLKEKKVVFSRLLPSVDLTIASSSTRSFFFERNSTDLETSEIHRLFLDSQGAQRWRRRRWSHRPHAVWSDDSRLWGVKSTSVGVWGPIWRVGKKKVFGVFFLNFFGVFLNFWSVLKCFLFRIPTPFVGRLGAPPAQKPTDIFDPETNSRFGSVVRFWKKTTKVHWLASEASF